MSFAATVLLGAVAGSTIFLGLPIGRVDRVDDRLRVALAMFSVGILAFIFMDVTSHGQEIVDTALERFKDHHASFGHVFGLFALLAGGFLLGTVGIAAAEQRLRRATTDPPSASPAGLAGGGALAPGGARPQLAGAVAAAISTPGAGGSAVAVEPSGIAVLAVPDLVARRQALRRGMTIAVAIGLHNFAEGLAIGVSAKAGAVGLATVLIVGFGLHNATEGFGIVGPLGDVRPSWSWLGLVGLIGGGPTFVGAIVGYQVHSDALELCFYALAGGAILYVVGEIWTGMRRYGHRTTGLYLLAAGFVAGVATDLIVSYGGA